MGLALVGGAMAMVTQATQLWHLFLLWSLLLGMGTGLTALVLGAVVANRWFAARRGLVIGVLTASAATGQLAFLPLAAWDRKSTRLNSSHLVISYSVFCFTKKNH